MFHWNQSQWWNEWMNNIRQKKKKRNVFSVKFKYNEILDCKNSANSTSIVYHKVFENCSVAILDYFHWCASQ